eukprot:361994-Chlamydomonas_euryale.AAC.3
MAVSWGSTLHEHTQVLVGGSKPTLLQLAAKLLRAVHACSHSLACCRGCIFLLGHVLGPLPYLCENQSWVRSAGVVRVANFGATPNEQRITCKSCVCACCALGGEEHANALGGEATSVRFVTPRGPVGGEATSVPFFTTVRSAATPQPGMADSHAGPTASSHPNQKQPIP